MSDTNQAGEVGEAAFILHAMRRGFACSKPMGGSSRYDVVLDAGKRLYRVQVKSASFEADKGKFVLTLTNSLQFKRTGRCYTNDEIDMLAAYISVHDLWYIIPVEAISSIKTISLRPLADNISRFAQYHEAWHLFTNDPPTSNTPTA